MRKLEFVNGPITGGLKVRLDGVVLQRVSLDTAAVKIAKENRMWTPRMQEDYLKQVQKRMADEGVREDEAKVIINRFKKDIEAL